MNLLGSRLIRSEQSVQAGFQSRLAFWADESPRRLVHDDSIGSPKDRTAPSMHRALAEHNLLYARLPTTLYIIHSPGMRYRIAPRDLPSLPIP